MRHVLILFISLNITNRQKMIFHDGITRKKRIELAGGKWKNGNEKNIEFRQIFARKIIAR